MHIEKPSPNLQSPQEILLPVGDLWITFIKASPITGTSENIPSGIHDHAVMELQFADTGTFTLETQAGERVLLDAGDSVLIPPHLLHRNPEQHEQFRRYGLGISLSRGTAHDGSFSEFEHYTRRFYALDHMTVLHSAPLAACIRRIVALDRLPPEEADHRIRIGLGELFLLLADALAEQAPPALPKPIAHQPTEPPSDERRKWVIENYISQCYMNPAPLENLSAVLFLSPRQADRVIRQLTGKSCHELILRQRMAVAEVLLRESAQPLGDIAFAVGFSSYAGFYTAFCRYFGQSPEAFRSKT